MFPYVVDYIVKSGCITQCFCTQTTIYCNRAVIETKEKKGAHAMLILSNLLFSNFSPFLLNKIHNNKSKFCQPVVSENISQIV